MARGDSFAGVTLSGGWIASRYGGGPVAGARAMVETAGQLSSRFTVTRLALLGPFALAAKKKKDHRELYLTVEGNGFAFTVPVSPKQGLDARQFAARINAAASAPMPQQPYIPPVPKPRPVPAAPPPGWYPDAERPGSQRWWDGTAWTDHRHA